MRLIFGDEDNAREIIKLLKMDPGDQHLDLQYRPFVDVGGYYVIAPHVVAAYILDMVGAPFSVMVVSDRRSYSQEKSSLCHRLFAPDAHSGLNT